MIKTVLGIEGMACGMCESHINDAIRKNFKVKKVTSSRKDRQTVIISEDELDADQIKNVIGQTGYDLVSIESDPYVKKGLFGR